MEKKLPPIVTPQAQIEANRAQERALDWAMGRIFPDWRVEELGRKYAPEDAYMPDDVEEEQE